MKIVPEKADLDEISRHCNRLVAYSHDHPHLEADVRDSILNVCVFISRTKESVLWLEEVIDWARHHKDRPPNP